MKDDVFLKAAEMLRVIAHPVRLSIISILEGKAMNVKDIQNRINAKQSITSQHLIAMSNKGILKRERKGNEVFYSIGNMNIFPLMKCIKNCCSYK